MAALLSMEMCMQRREEDGVPLFFKQWTQYVNSVTRCDRRRTATGRRARPSVGASLVSDCVCVRIQAAPGPAGHPRGEKR